MHLKTWPLAVAVAMACASPSLAQNRIQYTAPDGLNGLNVTVSNPLPVAQKAGAQTPLGYQQITSLSSATSLTVPAGATIAYVSVEAQGVRWRDDGASPTASVGMPVTVGQQLVYSGNLSTIKFIQQAASAIIDVAYYQ